MALYALADLDDALAVTREFLLPVRSSVWLRLALVSLFVGGPGTNVSGLQGSVGGNAGSQPPGQVPDVVLGPEAWAVVALAVLGVLVVGLAFVLVGSVMEFVLVESLRTRRVRIREYWGRRWRQGVRLFGFRLGLGLVVAGGVVLVALPLVFAAGGGDPAADGAAVALVLVLAPFLLVLGVLVAVVDGFTRVFVVPIMVLEGGGVLAGWRRLWPSITDQPGQYLAYAVAALLLTVTGGVLVGVVTAVIAVLVAIPFAVVGFVAAGLFGITSAVGLSLVGLAALLFVLVVVALAAVVQVPVLTYLRYYALLVLGDIEPDLDLVSEQRSAVRAEGGEAAA